MPGPGRNVNRPTAKPKNAMATFKRIFSYFKGQGWLIAVVVAGILVASVSSIAGTYMLKPIINDYIVPFIGQSDPDLTGLIEQLVYLGAIYLAGALAMWVYNRVTVTISTSVVYKLRRDMFTHMQKLPLRYFDSRTHGEIMSGYTNDTDSMRELLSSGIPQFISSFVRMVGIFMMMLVLSPLLTLVCVAMLCVIIPIITVLGKRSGKYFRERQGSLARVNGYIEEMAEGQREIKVFNYEGEACREFNSRNEELRKNTVKANTWAMILMPIMGNLSHVTYAACAAVGGIMAVNGLTDIGSIASFLQYSRNFSMPITQLSQQFNAVMSALAGAERIFALIDEPVEEDDGDVTIVYAKKNDAGELIESPVRTEAWAWKFPDGTLREVRGDVRLNDVTFSYNGEKTVLNDLSLYAKPGQKIAFVGSTGAGKTTITNLINRFYDVQEGEILYDGIPVKRIKKDDLRRSMAMVLQDTHLFTGSVRENIRYGRLDATDQEIIRAAKLANAHSFIMHLPDGYDTVLTADGANLSQGQRQLIAIARAAVADPPVLVLDEATSSIDTRTEALIERGMDSLMRGRTVFVIAHRLSTVRNSNAIMVLEHGEIIERGDHEELLNQKGKYYQLYMGMFELS